MSESRAEEVRGALEDYPATIVFDTENIVEFMASACEICQSPLAGTRIEFTEF